MRGRTRPVGLMRRGGRTGLPSAYRQLLSASFTSLSGGAVATALPGGFSFSRASDGYSVRTGTSTMYKATIASDTPRAGKGLDAWDVGLVLEGSFENLLQQSQTIGTAPWSTHSGTLTSNTADGPDGSTNTAERIATTSGQLGVGYYWLPDLTNGAKYVFSLWMKGPTGGENGIVAVTDSGTVRGKAAGGVLTSAWNRYGGSIIGGTDTGADLTQDFFWCGYAAASNAASSSVGVTGGLAAGNRDAHIWGANWGLGSILTEYVPTVGASVTRASERLYHSDVTRFVSNGRAQVYFKLRPKGATSDYQTDPYLWLTGSDYACVEPSTGKIVVVIGGTTYKTPVGMSWSANDLLEIWLEAGNGATYARYRVNGGSSILLSLGTPPQLGAVTPGATVDILCNGTSNTFTSWIYEIDAWVGSYEPSWAAMPVNTSLTVTASMDRSVANAKGGTSAGADSTHAANYKYTNLFASWKITTDATQLRVAFYTDNAVGASPNEGRIGIYDRGDDSWVYAQATVDDDVNTIDVNLPGTGERTVEVYNGLQRAWEGAWIRSVSALDGSVFRVQEPPSTTGKKLLIVYGDSIVEQTTSSATIHEYAPIIRLREALSNTVVIAEAYGGRGLSSDYSDGFVRLANDMRSAFDATSVTAANVIVYLQCSTNDYNAASFTTVAGFQTQYEALITKMRATFPSARIVCQTATQRTVETNGSGQTLTEYRTAISDAETAAGDANSEVLDGTTLIDSAAADTYDGVHLSIAGAEKYVTRLIAALGLT